MLYVDSRQSHPDVHADANAEITRKQPIVPGHVGCRVARRREGEGQELIIGLKVLFADASNVAVMFQGAVRPPMAAHWDAVRVDRIPASISPATAAPACSGVLLTCD